MKLMPVAAKLAESLMVQEDDELPCPFNPEQLRLMGAELEREMKELGPDATDVDAQAAVLRVVMKWTARAARLYAWRRICEVRAELRSGEASLMRKIEDLTREIDYLQGQGELKQTRRLKLYDS